MAGKQDEHGPVRLIAHLSSPASGIQITDEIGHLAAIETRPGRALMLHLLQHRRSVPPQRRDHRCTEELTQGSDEPRRSRSGIGMTAGATLREEDALAAPGVAGIFEELFRP